MMMMMQEDQYFAVYRQLVLCLKKKSVALDDLSVTLTALSLEHGGRGQWWRTSVCISANGMDNHMQLPSISTLLKKITVAHDLDSTPFYRSVVEQSLIFCRKNLNSVSLVWLFILYTYDWLYKHLVPFFQCSLTGKTQPVGSSFRATQRGLLGSYDCLSFVSVSQNFKNLVVIKIKTYVEIIYSLVLTSLMRKQLGYSLNVNFFVITAKAAKVSSTCEKPLSTCRENVILKVLFRVLFLYDFFPLQFKESRRHCGAKTLKLSSLSENQD